MSKLTSMGFRLPKSLQSQDDGAALALLARYYGRPFAGPGSVVGAAFDHLDSSGTRAQDLDRFTADDLVAVTFLSVDVSAPASRALLQDRADEFSALLADLGPDRDLVDESDPLVGDRVGWTAMAALRGLHRAGATTASELLARKRSRLRSGTLSSRR